MPEGMLSRTRMLLGGEAVARLSGCHVAVFGIGGVGGFAAEALVRSGVGAIDLVDGDSVQLSNLNRQIIATTQSIGRNKAELMRERALQINPNCRVAAIPSFYTEETADAFDLSRYDYILDCVDMVKAKVHLAVEAKRLQVPIISAMGAGNKLDPSLLQVADIAKTKICPLARVMRSKLRLRGIERLTVVYSTEEPARRGALPEGEVPEVSGRIPPASMAFVPGAMGLMMASHVVRALADVK